MSWISGRVGFLTAILFAVVSFAQTVTFDTSRKSAGVISRSLSTFDSNGLSDLQLELNVPKVNINRDRDGFDAIVVAGLAPTIDLGSPELASTGSLLAVPKGYDVKLDVVDQNVEILENVLARPKQKKMRCASHYASTFQFNSNLYQSGSVFPKEAVKLEEVGDLQGIRLVRVAMNPIQMDFGHRRLLVTNHLKVNVRFVKNGRPEKVVLPESIYNTLQAATANHTGRLIERAAGPETLVVLVADDLKAAISPYVAWKQAKGMNVLVYTNTQAGGTNEKIGEFLKNLYSEATVKPSYLLMVGNKDTMPTYMESTGSGSAASDWRYSLLSGASDRVPDLFYGRFVADNAAEVATQVKRAINYEKSPELNAFYHNGMTIASNEGSNPSDKDYALQIQEALKKGTYQSMDNFFQGEQTATSSNIIGALETGRSWIAYFGHGSGTSWGSTNDYFGNSTVDGLKNTRLPIIIDVACDNASWVALSKPFGKAWVTGEKNDNPNGAVAFYGGSVSISWDPPAVMSVGVAKSHFEKNLATVGASVTAGQLYLFEQMGTENDTLDNMKWYNLLGDPALVVRTDEPAQYNVKKQIIQQGGKAMLSVTTTKADGSGVGELLVAVSKTNDSRIAPSVAKTDATGKAMIDLSEIGGLGGTVVTITGYNANTYFSNITE